MILYRLTNWNYTLDIYQTELTFKPHWYLRVLSFGAKKTVNVDYAELERMEVQDPFYFYPGSLRFMLKGKNKLHFSFQDEAQFYRRLKLYIDKQRGEEVVKTRERLAA